MPEASDMLNQSKAKLMQLLSNPNVVASLLAGLGTGVVGGALSAGTPQRRGESRGARRRRILRNALLAGGAGAAATGGALYGLGQLGSVLPEDTEQPLSGLMDWTGEAVGAGIGAVGLGKQLSTNKANSLKALLTKSNINSLGVPAEAAVREYMQGGPSKFGPKNPASLLHLDELIPEALDRGADLGFKTNWKTPGSAKQKAMRALKRHPYLASAALGAGLYNPVKGILSRTTNLMPNISTYGDR